MINNFQLNVAVANIYEIFNLFSSFEKKVVSNQCLKKNFVSFMKLMIPFTPFLAHECLEQLGIKEINNWPKIEKELIASQKVKRNVVGIVGLVENMPSRKRLK